MYSHPLIQILSLLWKLLTVLIIPIIIAIYIKVLSHWHPELSFASLDNGKNVHKWIIISIYALFLIGWNKLNPYVAALLKKMEY